MTTKIVHEPQQRHTVIRLRSELTHNEAGRLRDLVLERWAERAPHFVLEMSELRFIDSEGLAALLWIRERIAGWGGQLRLLRPSGEVRQILRITRLQDRFPVFEEMQDATCDLS